MATFSEAMIQQDTAEVRKWTVDFTDDLPSAVTVTGGTAVHIPPSGAAATVTTTAASPYVYAQLGPLTVTGNHYLDVRGTFSNGEISAVRVSFAVVYPSTTARSGMLDLIDTLRGMTDTSPADYTIAGVPYWSDAQVQKALDRHRTDVYRDEAYSVETYNNGTVQYKEYFSTFGNLEQTTGGTEIFYLENAAGTVLGTSLYSMDYDTGKITFTSDTTGSAVFVYGRSYDMNAAAADIWRLKAGQVAKAYDFSTDNHNLRRSQMITNCLGMAQYYASQAAPRSMAIERNDNAY